MALEDVMKGLTEALIANTAAVKAQTELVQRAMANGGSKPAAAAATETAAAAAAAAAPAGGKKGPGRPKKADAAAAAATTIPTEDDLRNLAGSFLKVDDAAEKESRREFIAEMNEFFGVQNVLQIPETRRAEAMEFIKKRATGVEVTFAAADSETTGTEDEGDDALI